MMEIYEIAGWSTGVSKAGVNFLQPSDTFQNIFNGFIYRQVLQSRQGFRKFAPRLAGQSRIMGIFEHTLVSGSKESLAFDCNFLYKYNLSTNTYDQIPFGGSMAAYPGFGLIFKDAYISGTSYSGIDTATLDHINRFVFTGAGIDLNSNNSAVFFYDGTEVKDFTDLTDNPTYAAPLEGVLNRAEFIEFFGERLNLMLPTIQFRPYSQGLLYSAIRNNAGNGDKFNVAGAGLAQVDTSQNITGVEILGQTISLNFDRSNYIVEKTQDAFNPYFIRKVPSVLGTNAKFSTVQWDDIVRSMGRTGILGTDGRETLRVDNKIPDFTRKEIVGSLFNLTYGGFDRNNHQFLWSYVDPDLNTDTQNRVLVGNYEEDTWAEFDQRFTVFGETALGQELTWDEIDETINTSWDTWDHTTDLWDEIGIEDGEEKTLAGDDLGFIYEINKDFDDYFSLITSISQAAEAVLVIEESGFQVGDYVAIQSAEGMVGINNFFPEDNTTNINFTPYEVLAASTTSITINRDTTLLDAHTPDTGSVFKIINFSAETIPFNPYRSIGYRCYISHVEFLIDANGGCLKLDIYADEQGIPYKQDIIAFPTVTDQAREWITISVDNEANFHTFVLKQTSPGVQLKITSMRIHCKPGGLTSG